MLYEAAALLGTQRLRSVPCHAGIDDSTNNTAATAAATAAAAIWLGHGTTVATPLRDQKKLL